MDPLQAADFAPAFDPARATEVFSLSVDQEEAAHDIMEAVTGGQRVMTLAGYAGTGKTTIVREIGSRLRCEGWEIAYMAPTGKAAHRLSQVVGCEATTIHQARFEESWEGEDGQPVFGGEKAICDEYVRTAVVCDEASMVGTWLFSQLVDGLPPNSVLIGVGDQGQLEPVMDTWGFDLEDPTARLTRVHRQALERPLYRIITDLRERGVPLPRGDVGDDYSRRAGNRQDVASWFLEHEDDDIVLMTWSNKSRQRTNRLVRVMKGIHETPLVVGERLVVLQNNHALGKMNGEILVVTRLEQAPGGALRVFWGGRRRGSALVHPELIGADTRTFRAHVGHGWMHWLHVDHGYCLTVHKMQGSEARIGGVVLDDTARWAAKKSITEAVRAGKKPEESSAFRWTYTAATRAKERLVVWDVD